MKLITAIVRHECVNGLIPTLVETGVRGLTVSDVKGFGRQYGQRVLAGELAGLDRNGGLSGRPIALLPKVRLDLVVLDSEVDGIIEMLLKSGETGAVGDGKIWIAPLDGVIRVRTGESGDEAV